MNVAFLYNARLAPHLKVYRTCTCTVSHQVPPSPFPTQSYPDTPEPCHSRGPRPIVTCTLRFMYKTYLCMCQEKFRCILFHRYICRIRGYSDTPGWPHCTGYRWHTHQCLCHTWSPPIRFYTDTHEHCHTLRLRARSYKASYILVRNDVHHSL